MSSTTFFSRSICFCLLGFFLLIFSGISAHEEHHSNQKYLSSSIAEGNETAIPTLHQDNAKLNRFLVKFGRFHLLFLHFPIALIVMTCFAEILNCFYKSPLFEEGSRFMMVTAAITVIPTAITGLALSYTAHYQGLEAVFFWWHLRLGLFTTFWTCLTAYFREWDYDVAYLISLAILFVLVVLTGYFGGGLSFSPEILPFVSS